MDSPHPVYCPGPPCSLLGLLAPAPVMLQWGSAQFCLASHGPWWARPTCSLISQPGFRWRCPIPSAGDAPWLPVLSWESLLPLAPSPQGAANLWGTLTLFFLFSFLLLTFLSAINFSLSTYYSKLTKLHFFTGDFLLATYLLWQWNHYRSDSGDSFLL